MTAAEWTFVAAVGGYLTVGSLLLAALWIRDVWLGVYRNWDVRLHGTVLCVFAWPWVLYNSRPRQEEL